MTDNGKFGLRSLIRGLVSVFVAVCLFAATATVPASAQPDPDLAGIDAFREGEAGRAHSRPGAGDRA